MTTKYTDEEIIAYLRTLREGDVLTAAKSDKRFTAGGKYVAEADEDGDLIIRNNYDGGRYVHLGDNYKCRVFGYIREGIFEIPTQSKPFALAIMQSIETGQYAAGTHYHVNVSVNEAGLAKLRDLEAGSLKAEELAHLYAERGEIQRKIDEMEAVE